MSAQTDHAAALSRIADALEAMTAQVRGERPDWTDAPAYVWTGSGARGVSALQAPTLDQLHAIDRQKETVVANIRRMAQGAAAHDMLLWGARGMGKSALLRAAVIDAAKAEPGRIALVQVGTDALATLPDLFAELARIDRAFLVFIDDLAFDEGGSADARHLRSWLEGGVEARPGNVRLAITSNRRAIVARDMAEQDDPINPRDVVDDRLALADRFGQSVGFHAASQDDYLAIVAAYADPLGLDWDEADALEWARRRGARSGRTAWHYVTELAGRAGRALG